MEGVLNESGIKFYFQGDNAKENAIAFSSFCEKNFNCKPYETLLKNNKDQKVSKADPFAVAALILTIPPAILASIDLVERFKSKKNAEAFIQFAKDCHDKNSQIIKIQDKNGRLITLHLTDSSTLLNIV